MGGNGVSQRLKVLLSAYACESGKGSEPGVGWGVAREMARFHDVWVITRANNRTAIEAELARNPVPGLNFVYYDLPRWARFWKSGQRGVQLYYYLWQIGAYFVARNLHRRIGFDLIHHVTFVKYWSPSLLALLPVPFIWGPVGGGESAPRAFWRDFSLRGHVYEALRGLARWLGEHDPLVRLTARRSAVALATTNETAARLRKLGARNVQVFSEVGLSKEEIAELGKIEGRSGNPVWFISIGRLLHWKGFHLGLRAFAEAGLAGAEYWIVGDGPERRRLETLARNLGIAERVKFWGTLPREETLQKLAECDVLVHPSLHDSGGWVCIEAMAAGKPIICLDLGGPAIQVTNRTGFKVPALAPVQAVSQIAIAIRRLASEPRLRKSMREAGRRRVTDHFEWSKKINYLLQIYEEAQNSAPRGDKQD